VIWCEEAVTMRLNGKIRIRRLTIFKRQSLQRREFRRRKRSHRTELQGFIDSSGRCS